jgi:hypothetical protein
VTADGRRISLLPAAEATALMQQWKAAAGSSAAPSTPAAAAHPVAGAMAAAGHSSPDGAFAAWAAAQRHAAQQHTGQDVPSKFATSVTRLTVMPQRQELSERDIELIELGGAAP